MLQFFTGSSKNRLEIGTNVEFQHPVSNSWTNGVITKDEGDSYYSIQSNSGADNTEGGLHVHIHVSKIRKVASAERRSSLSFFSGSSKTNSSNNSAVSTATSPKRRIRSLLHIAENDSPSSKPVSLIMTRGKSMSKSIRDLMQKEDQFTKKIERRHIENEELVILERVRKCNQSGRKLLDITKLDLADELPEQFQVFSMITELNARKNHFTTLQPFALFSKLLVLEISFNLLGETENDSTAFELLSQMRQLATLDLSNNNLTLLPGSIVRLMKLERLNIRKNKISTLPSNFSELKNLTFFDCSHNLLVDIPAVIDFICVPVGKLVDLNLDSNPCLEDRETALNNCGEKTRFLLEKHDLLINRGLRKQLVQRATAVRHRVVELEQSKIMADAAARDPVVAAHLQHHH